MVLVGAAAGDKLYGGEEDAEGVGGSGRFKLMG